MPEAEVCDRWVSDLPRDAAELENRGAATVVAWARDRFGPGLVLTSSFTDCVMIDVATSVVPDIEVVFLDTGAHFPETLDYLEVVRRRYDLNLVVLHPSPGADAWPCGTARCCELRKVAPLAAHLATRTAWMTGLRRVETPPRANAAVVARDAAMGVVKINPLAAWSDRDVARYSAERNLPAHPLASAGYLSIGCAPMTAAVAEGDDHRAGRWAGTSKTECGLHV